MDAEGKKYDEERSIRGDREGNAQGRHVHGDTYLETKTERHRVRYIDAQRHNTD